MCNVDYTVVVNRVVYVDFHWQLSKRKVNIKFRNKQKWIKDWRRWWISELKVKRKAHALLSGTH
jgi:hypothetical protein